MPWRARTFNNGSTQKSSGASGALTFSSLLSVSTDWELLIHSASSISSLAVWEDLEIMSAALPQEPSLHMFEGPLTSCAAAFTTKCWTFGLWPKALKALDSTSFCCSCPVEPSSFQSAMCLLSVWLGPGMSWVLGVSSSEYLSPQLFLVLCLIFFFFFSESWFEWVKKLLFFFVFFVFILCFFWVLIWVCFFICFFSELQIVFYFFQTPSSVYIFFTNIQCGSLVVAGGLHQVGEVTHEATSGLTVTPLAQGISAQTAWPIVSHCRVCSRFGSRGSP